MTTNYTTRFRFNKPDFRQSPWSSLINENTDRIDEVIYNVLQANSIVTYSNNLDVVAGTTVYDSDVGSLWLCRNDFTTAATGTFAEDRAANPDDWASVTLGLTVRGQWLINTHYAVNDLVYDASEGLTGYCKTEHTSGAGGSMRDEIADWNIIFDSNNGGTVPATAVAYDDTGQPYTAANVQAAIDEANALIEGNTDDIATNASAIAANTTAIANNTTAISANTTAIATKADASSVPAVAATADIIANTGSDMLTTDKVWAAGDFVAVNATGTCTLDLDTGLNFVVTLTGNTTMAMPTNGKIGQVVNILFLQGGTARTISWASSWFWPDNVAPTYGVTINDKAGYVSGIVQDAAVMLASGGRYN